MTKHSRQSDTEKRLRKAAETADTQPLSAPGLPMDVAGMRTDIHRHLCYTLGRDSHSVSNRYRVAPHGTHDLPTRPPHPPPDTDPPAQGHHPPLTSPITIDLGWPHHR